VNTREVTQAKQRLDAVFKVGQSLDDLDAQAHFARYLCVLTSGFIETSVRAIFASYARLQSGPAVQNFVECELTFFQNPKMEKILELARAFKPEWEDALRRETDGQLKDAVDSIVANRNRIAHGESVGLSLAVINRYYADASRVVELLEKQCR
jgi:hypothetical protein